MRSFPILSWTGRAREPRPRLKERLDAAAALVRSVVSIESAVGLNDHILRDIGLWRDRWGRLRDAEPSAGNHGSHRNAPAVD